jgi:hypothetical protein
MSKFSLVLLIFFSVQASSYTFAQSAFAPLNTDNYHNIERFEILSRHIIPNIFTSTKPYSRKSIATFIENFDSTKQKYKLSRVDLNNIQYFKNDNWEWLKAKNDSSTYSKKRLWNLFFEHKSDFYSIKNNEFDLHINPIFQFSGGQDGTITTWQNTRGIEIRGSISKKLGFYTMFTENQVVLPNYINEFHRQNQVLPGEGHLKPFGKNGFDYISGRGYITFSPIKPINIIFGHDKTFLGSGLRSMFLSDFSAPTLFLKINTQIGKVQYQNQFTQLTDYQNYGGNSVIIPKKYMVSHHLGINITKKFNLGLMETVVLDRSGGLDLNYLNPVIFYRFIESFVGSPDNAMAGINFRKIAKRNISVYGQFLFDELVLKDLFKNSGRFTNKYAYQIGAKAINLFGIKNFDFQTEYNAARPYTYSHLNTTTNYAHYNQALAHPLGANFKEWASIIRYQFSPKFLLVGTYLDANYGLDRQNQNWGGNILLDYETRVRDQGNYIGQGLNTTLNFAEIRASFEVIHNMYLDGSFIYRTTKNIKQTSKATIPSMSLRWNLPYKQTAF